MYKRQLYQYDEVEAAYLPLPYGSWGYDASLESMVPSYDPEDAKACLLYTSYVTGVGDGYYDPDRTVMRQELAAILYRQAGLPAVVGQNLGKYQDRKEIASWAVSPMLWCVQTEIVRGKSADLIAPEDPVTVAEALTMLKLSLIHI